VTTDAPTPPWQRWTAVVAWMGVIFWLSSRPSLPRTPGTPPDVASILGHLVAYAVLASLLAWAIDQAGRPLAATMAIAWVVASLYGVTDEVHQSFVPNRDADDFDVLTDAVGAAVALVAVWWRARQRTARRRPRP